MQQLLDLKNLQVFQAFCQHMNMSVAAKRLGITQSAVSQHIQQLEANLGVQLINREVRPLQLTASGKLLKCRSRMLLIEAEKTTTLLRQKAGLRYPHMTIGLVSSFADMCLPNFFKETSKLVDRITFRTAPPEILSQALLNHDLDCIVASDPFFEIPQFERHKIIKEPFIIIYPEALNKKKKNVTLEDIAEHYPFVQLPITVSIERRIVSYLRMLGLSLQQKMEVQSFTSIAGLVEAEMGWSIITPLVLALAKRRNILHECGVMAFPTNDIYRTLWVLSHQDELGEYPQKIAKLSAKLIADDWLADVEKQFPDACGLVKTYN